MKNIGKLLSLAVAGTVAVSSVLGGISLTAFAKEKTFKICDLIKSGKAKTFGRYSEKDGKMSGFWAGNGFEIKVKCKGETTLRVVCETNDKVYLAAFVDGNLQDRESPITENITDLFVSVPNGEHTVRIVRDTQINRDADKYFYFNSVEFEGEILKLAEKSDLYIEVIGDSIACGDGANGVYTRGVGWKDPEDHSFVKGFAYKLAAELSADYSAIARGGIGLLTDNSGSQETADPSKIPMQDIYDYVNGYTDLKNGAPKYDFARKPDLIVLELGANDSNELESKWREDLIAFVNHLKEVNGENVPIVWLGKNQVHYTTVCSVINENEALKPFYACQNNYGGSGAAALPTQESGHPDSAEQTRISEALVRFIKAQKVIEIPEEDSNDTDTNTETETETESKKDFPIKTVGIAGGAAVLAGAAAALIIAKKKKKKK